MQTGLFNHINYLLTRWARWKIKQYSNGLGYAPVSIMFKQTPRTIDRENTDTWVPSFELRVLDSVIERLTTDQQRLISVCYCNGLTRDAQAAELGCSRPTITKRLNDLAIVVNREMQA